MTARNVVIADYGIGNLLSAQRALAQCGANVTRTSDPETVASADRLVLPGVGAFASCVRTLVGCGLVEPVRRFVASGRPLLGICVGMQMLFDESEEFGVSAGLKLLPGRIKRIEDTDANGVEHRIPHIGWSALATPVEAAAGRWSQTILDDTEPGAEVYFVHSYTAWPANPAHRLADVDYGGRRISAAVHHDNIFGTQFHPEKSGPVGLRIVEAFLKL